eukprot:403349609
MKVQEETLTGCRNIWDYILLQKSHKNSQIYQQQVQMPSGDGIYFKYKDNKIKKQDSKKLQVFSQTVNTGQKTLVITTIRDMSHWIELQKQKNLTLFKTQAFAQAAHEFRNPLGAIITSLELIKNHIDMDQVGQFYMTAKNCSTLLLFLVNDILDYSQLESKKILTNCENIIIEQTLKECIEVLNFKAQSKGLELSLLIDERVPRKLMTDYNRLRQILINLISNSIKYTHTGYIKVRVLVNEQNSKLLIQVEDTGVGICKEDQDKLFNAYVKIKNNRNLNKDGCGLGLTICKKLAEALGGKIKMQSEIGQGSTFTLKLPIQHSQSQDIRSQAYLNLYHQTITQEDISNEILREVQQFSRQNLVEKQLLSPHRCQSAHIKIKKKAVLKKLRHFSFQNIPSDLKCFVNTEVNFTEDSETYQRKDLAMNLQEYLQSQELLFTKSKSQQMADDFDEGVIDLQQVRFDFNQRMNPSVINTAEMITPQCSNNNNNQYRNFSNTVAENNIQSSQNNIIEIQSASAQSSLQAGVINQQQAQILIQQNLGVIRESQNPNNQQIHSNNSRNSSFQRLSSQRINDQESAKTPCNHAKILIIDDDPFNNLILEGMLQQLKITKVDKCYDGFTALKKMDQNFTASFDCNFHTPGRETCCKSHKPYQLVIVDNQMPQMSGLEVGQEIRMKQKFGELPQSLKIMLLSGDERLLHNSQAQNIFDFIQLKPISIDNLKIIVQNIEL